ncbi:hypothetical protein ACKFKF_07460 [Phormidesmis sp. 146-12]
MNISDLNYLESVSNSSNIVGGGKFKIKFNVAEVYQYSDATALALNFGKKGDAYAYNDVYQKVSINQRN